jgi:ABC-2 type transport system ATP-binding protein
MRECSPFQLRAAFLLHEKNFLKKMNEIQPSSYYHRVNKKEQGRNSDGRTTTGFGVSKLGVDCSFDYYPTHSDDYRAGGCNKNKGYKWTKMVMGIDHPPSKHHWTDYLLCNRKETKWMNVIIVKDLEKKYKEKLAVEKLNFQLEEGKCTALLGPNGAGKTTTIKMLAGLISPSSGSVFSDLLPNKKDLRLLIGYLPQYPSFFEWMTAEEYMVFSGEVARMDRQGARKRTDELLELVGLEEARKRKIGQFSGGMKQRLGIAQALIHRPRLIMLDEPVSALDPFGRREVLELMGKLKQETTILFSTHILNDAEEICDDILFLHNGQLVENGSMKEIKQKYKEAMLTVQLEENAEKYIKHFIDLPSIQGYKLNGDLVRLEVSDVNAARDEVLKAAAGNGIPINKFEMSESSLEDIFMKVVK